MFHHEAVLQTPQLFMKNISIKHDYLFLNSAIVSSDNRRLYCEPNADIFNLVLKEI